MFRSLTVSQIMIQWVRNPLQKDVKTLRQRETGFWDRQQHAPLFDALVRHAKRKPYPFHVPGHKMGNSFDREGKKWFQSILSIDMTEISGLDDLHQPEGIIAEAQSLAAEAFWADETRFLIGGSTVGNMALIMAVCRPGDKIIVQRNCHKSVYHGLILARANPIFIVPAVDLATGAAAGLRREDVERTLQEHPDAKAVFLTNPTYYGMGIELAKMAAAVHRFHIPLLVDEAHGAHYGFHPALPPSAMQCGADAAVQSTHKMAASLTMSSMLHIQGSRIDRDRLSRALAMIQSSSPSYPLLASLDLARRHMVFEAEQEFDRVLPLLERLRERIAALPWLQAAALTESSVYSTLDPLKLMLCLRTDTMTGFQLRSLMEEQGIFPELADSGHVLLAASTGTSSQDVERVWQLLESVTPPSLPEAELCCRTDPANAYVRSRSAGTGGVLASSFLREQAMPMHEALDAEKRAVSLAEAEGKISAEMVIPYPPGIPLVVPGERIDVQLLSLLRTLRAERTRFHGIKDASLETIQVVV
jgi:arginine/lysine/ornithine decarboxylase